MPPLLAPFGGSPGPYLSPHREPSRLGCSVISGHTCALADPDGSTAIIHTDGAIHATGRSADQLAAHLHSLATGWNLDGRPAVTDWIVALRPAECGDSFHVPDGWRRSAATRSTG